MIEKINKLVSLKKTHICRVCDWPRMKGMKERNKSGSHINRPIFNECMRLAKEE